jgi:hypothetical protein
MTRKQKARIWNKYIIPAIETAVPLALVLAWLAMAAAAEYIADILLQF